MKIFPLNNSMSKFYLIIILITLLSQSFSKAQTTSNCLSAEHLQIIYQHDADFLEEFLSPPKWIRISQTEHQPLAINNDTAFYRETVWQFTMSFSYILLKIYDNPDFDNIMKLSMSEECYQPLFHEFTINYPNPITNKMDPHTSTFLFEMNRNSNALFTEKIDNENKEFTFLYYNPTEVSEQAKLYQENKIKQIEAQKLEKLNFLHSLHLSDSLYEIREFEQAFLLLDSLTPPLEYEKIYNEKRELTHLAIKNRDIALLLEEGKSFVETNQFYRAKEKFEKIIRLDSSHIFAKEQLTEIEKKIAVLAIRSTTVFDYYKEHSAVIDTLYCEIEDWINTFIEDLSYGTLQGTVEIKVDTFGQNQSLFLLDTFICDTSIEAIKKQELVTFMEAMLSSFAILPVTKENIFVQASSLMQLSLNWDTKDIVAKFNQYKIKIQKKDAQWQPEIASLLFSDLYPTGKYHFSIKDKKFNNRSLTDISFKKINFVGPEAAFYSMLFPGVGTILTTQGKHGIGAMTTFVIFGAGTVVSYIYSRKLASQAATFPTDSPEYEKYRMNSNLLMTGAYAGIGICGVIYISDVVTALIKGIDNLKKASAIKKNRIQGTSDLQYEAIELIQ